MDLTYQTGVAPSCSVDLAPQDGLTGLPLALVTEFTAAFKAKLTFKLGEMMTSDVPASLSSFGLCKWMHLKARQGASGSGLSRHPCPGLIIR